MTRLFRCGFSTNKFTRTCQSLLTAQIESRVEWPCTRWSDFFLNLWAVKDISISWEMNLVTQNGSISLAKETEIVISIAVDSGTLCTTTTWDTVTFIDSMKQWTIPKSFSALWSSHISTCPPKTTWPRLSYTRRVTCYLFSISIQLSRTKIFQLEHSGSQIISFFLNLMKNALVVTDVWMVPITCGSKCIHTSTTIDQITSSSTYRAELASYCAHTKRQLHYFKKIQNAFCACQSQLIAKNNKLQNKRVHWDFKINM